jgi:hypothetical protein
VNRGSGRFDDASYASGSGRDSRPDHGVGTVFADVDNDGDEDLFTANGHIYPQIDQGDFGTTYGQRNRLHLNESKPGGPCKLSEWKSGGPAFDLKRVSRGAVAADFDADGDLDLVVAELDATPTLLVNESEGLGHWLIVELRSETANRFGVGAWVSFEAGGRVQHREIRSSASYLSAEPLEAFFGLGSTTSGTLRVRFPSGRSVEQRVDQVDRRLRLLEPRAEPTR